VTSSTLLDRLLAPPDAVRRWVFVEAQRFPPLGTLLARRDPRLLAQSCLGASFALLLTMTVPGIPYVLGPALFGVPHVAAELRLLVLRRDLPRSLLATMAVGATLLFLLRFAEAAWPVLGFGGRVEVGLGWSLGLAGALFGAFVSRRWARGTLVAAPIAGALVVALSQPSLARLVFAHAHNLITIALWVWLFRRRPRFAIPAVVLIAMAAALLASGAVLPFTHLSGPWVDRVVTDTLSSLPRSVPQPIGVGLALSYVFLQQVHYAVWLAWIPQEDLPVEGTTSFRMSARSIARDLGGVGTSLVVAASLLVVGASFVDVHRTRAIYLSLATFHGYVEVALLAFFVARRAPVRAPRWT
jgi:MFS family permease